MSTINYKRSDDDMVICPACVHEFCAIPMNVQAEITELREALKVAQIEIEVRKGRMSDVAAHCATVEQERDILQAKLSAIEAQEPYCWLYKDDMGDVQIFFVDPPQYSKALYAAAPVAPAHPTNAKAAQPLTKEQVDKVIRTLHSSASWLKEGQPLRIACDEAIEIMKGVRV